LPIGAFDRGKKHRVRSELSYFVEAYRSIKLGDFSHARQIFDEAAALYDMASPQSTYMLPYYALASARAGADVSNVEKILDRLNPKEQRFDYQLAKAAFEAVGGRMSEALGSLRLARYRRPATDERVQLTQFTFADICESLFQATGDAGIRRVALDWARSRERAEPWQSWSYSLEAVLAPDSVDRKRALAMAHYLDPKSAHLLSFKKSEIDEAVKMFAPTNIFMLTKRDGAKGAAT
jgi:ABC-type amino acid transport substrate-binding protein